MMSVLHTGRVSTIYQIDKSRFLLSGQAIIYEHDNATMELLVNVW